MGFLGGIKTKLCYKISFPSVTPQHLEDSSSLALTLILFMDVWRQ